MPGTEFGSNFKWQSIKFKLYASLTGLKSWSCIKISALGSQRKKSALINYVRICRNLLRNDSERNIIINYRYQILYFHGFFCSVCIQYNKYAICFSLPKAKLCNRPNLSRHHVVINIYCLQNTQPSPPPKKNVNCKFNLQKNSTQKSDCPHMPCTA